MKKHDLIQQDEVPTYFLRWHEGRLNRAEKKKLDNWLNASPGNRKEWELFSQAWTASKQMSIPEGKPAGEQWDDFSVNIRGRNSNIPSRLSTKPPMVKSPFRLAIYGLTVLGIVLAVVAVYQRLGSGNEQQFVPFGQRVTVNLADDTVVELGPGSTLDYSGLLAGNERQVKMTGEAFFSVAIGDRPFVVGTEMLDVRVTGTKFNVSTWHGITKVYVQEGTVEVIGSTSSAPVMRISAGQMAVFEKGSLYRVENAEAGYILGWREGRLAFRDTPFPEVAADLERTYDVKIDADDKVLRHSITASFDKQPVDEVLEMLALAVGGKVMKTEWGYRIEE